MKSVYRSAKEIRADIKEREKDISYFNDALKSCRDPELRVDIHAAIIRDQLAVRELKNALKFMAKSTSESWKTSAAEHVQTETA